MQFVGKKEAFLHFLAFFGCSDYLPLACSSVSCKARLIADRSLPELWAQIGESNSDQHDTGIERSLRDRQIRDWLTMGDKIQRRFTDQGGNNIVFSRYSVNLGFIWSKPAKKDCSGELDLYLYLIWVDWSAFYDELTRRLIWSQVCQREKREYKRCKVDFSVKKKSELSRCKLATFTSLSWKYGYQTLTSCGTKWYYKRNG